MVLIVTGVAGAVLGIGLTQLMGEDASVAEQATPPGTAERDDDAPAAGPVLTSSGGRLRVDVVSAVWHPVTSTRAADRRARIGVHVRITNNTDRDFALTPPALLVGEDRRRIQTTPAPADAGMPAVLHPGGIADTTLNFELASESAEQLTSLPLVLRVATKNLPLAPVLGSTVRG